MEKGQQEIQKGLEDMQKRQEETRKGQQEMQKGLENVQKCQEDLKNALEKKIDNVEEKINSVEEKIALKVEEKIAVVEEKIKKVEQVEVRIREQVDERIEEVAGNFSHNCERNNLCTVFHGRPEGEIQKAVRMADFQDLKSALLYALKLEAATQASHKDRHFIQEPRVTADEPCESRLLKVMKILKEEMQTIKAGISNQEKRNFRCWGCGGTGHLRRNCSRSRKDVRTQSLLLNRKTNIWPSRGAEVAR
ncbi:uncharacterized protein TNCV_688531 [Trichonephila clavipes]|nr:uncharacterized protein TNCV_688531 [Trichonephila clavipes]